MTSLSAIEQFKSMAENRKPTCEEVGHLLAVAGEDRKEFEDYLAGVCKNWGFDLDEYTLSTDFVCVYCDGVSVLKRAPNGNYLAHVDPVVTGYVDD